MPVENATPAPLTRRANPFAEGAPVAIEVRDLKKAFRIPTQRVDSLKERVVHPFAGREYRELRALDGVSFEIHRGEFFGIVGRNGSGKSTLLKLLASIYRADAGTIRMAGRLAPFIELGVGFNPELTARENVVLNGVMMGLTPQETRDRLDAVVAFAELEEFIDLKLKNYSSGMLVRLAFSLMLEVDADILLIDEVLAVGDAAFQQKCADSFNEMKAAGKTIILVTHDMPTVEEYAHRAMLIDSGQIQHLGDPGEVGRRYVRLNFEEMEDSATEPKPENEEGGVEEFRLLDSWIENEEGRRVHSVEHGKPIRFSVELEVAQATSGISIGFILANSEGIHVFQFDSGPVVANETMELPAGERVVVRAELENLLADGRYFIHCGINRIHGGVALYVQDAVDFVVFGSELQGHGIIALPCEVEATTDGGGGRS
jgi:ABC-2 type transport system ATP-binding protein